MADLTQQSYSEDVANELGLTASAYASDVADEVSLTSAAYGEDVADAINGLPAADLRVCQYNIGHFAMGASPNNDTTPAWTDNTVDGYPSSISRNYSTQLQRWTDRISGIKADIIGMPEYSSRFGRHNNADVATVDTGIFDGYNISYGKSESGGYWINAIASKFSLSNAQDIDLGSTTSNKAYVRVATVTIKGKTVKVAVTHLNWNNPLGATTDTTYSTNATLSRESRQKEIKALVKLFQNDSYVILCGDFNTSGPVYGPNVSYNDRDFLAGIDEFDPFIEGFTEDGVTYNGGFTLANNAQHPLATADATNSRPDATGADRPSVPFAYIDNIIVKGFALSNVTVVDDGRLTDHCALYCDLTMIEEGGSND